MFSYWTMSAFFISTIIFVAAAVLNYFLREKYGYKEFRDESEGGEE